MAEERITILEQLVRKAQELLSSDPSEIAYSTDDGFILNFTYDFENERDEWLQQAKNIVEAD